MKNIVVIGGGTGLSALTRVAAKLKGVYITSVVSVADNGGSTGLLRNDFNIPAVGDLRRVIGAMSDQDDLMVKLLEYRFDKRNKGLSGHTLGNLILTALIEMTGDLSKAVKWLSKYMQSNGDIFSVSDDELTLMTEYEDGYISEGEIELINNKDKIIKSVFYKEKKAKPNLHVVQAIINADIIIFGMGSLFTSIIPNLLFDDVAEAIKNSKANKYYIANLMQEPGETIGFKLSDHIKVLNKYIGAEVINKVIFSNSKFPEHVLKKYKLAGQEPVENDCKKEDVILYDLLTCDDDIARHDEEVLAQALKVIF